MACELVAQWTPALHIMACALTPRHACMPAAGRAMLHLVLHAASGPPTPSWRNFQSLHLFCVLKRIWVPEQAT